MAAAAAALDLEDDSFFNDLSQQISLLINEADDDESNINDRSLVHYPSMNLKALNQGIIHPASPALCPDHYRRESRGTGVFIPHPRMKNGKQGKVAATGNKQLQWPKNGSSGKAHAANVQDCNIRRF